MTTTPPPEPEPQEPAEPAGEATPAPGYPTPPPLPPEAYPSYTGGSTYGYGEYGAPPVQRRNGMGTAALICGIVSLVFAGPVLGILAVVFGRIGMNRADAGQATNRSQAQWGFILGIVGLVLWVVAIIILSARQ